MYLFLLLCNSKMGPCCSLRGSEGNVNSLVMGLRSKNQPCKLPAGSHTHRFRQAYVLTSRLHAWQRDLLFPSHLQGLHRLPGGLGIELFILLQRQCPTSSSGLEVNLLIHPTQTTDLLSVLHAAHSRWCGLKSTRSRTKQTWVAC